MVARWGMFSIVLCFSIAAVAQEPPTTISKPVPAQALPKIDCTITVGGECQTAIGSIEVKQGPTPRLNQAEKDIEELKKQLNGQGGQKSSTIERVTEREVVERMPIAIGVDALVPFNGAYMGGAARLNFNALTLGRFNFDLYGSIGAVHFNPVGDNPIYLAGGLLGGHKLGPGNAMLGLNVGGTNRLPGMEHFEYGPSIGYDYQFRPGWSVNAFWLPHLYKPFFNQDGSWQGRATIGFTYQPESTTASEKTTEQLSQKAKPQPANSVKGKLAKNQ